MAWLLDPGTGEVRREHAGTYVAAMTNGPKARPRRRSLGALARNDPHRGASPDRATGPRGVQHAQARRACSAARRWRSTGTTRARTRCSTRSSSKLMAGVGAAAEPMRGDWIDALRDVAHAYRRIAHDHPKAFPLLATRRFASEGTYAFLEQLFELARSRASPTASRRASIASSARTATASRSTSSRRLAGRRTADRRAAQAVRARRRGLGVARAASTSTRCSSSASSSSSTALGAQRDARTAMTCAMANRVRRHSARCAARRAITTLRRRARRDSVSRGRAARGEIAPLADIYVPRHATRRVGRARPRRRLRDRLAAHEADALPHRAARRRGHRGVRASTTG